MDKIDGHERNFRSLKEHLLEVLGDDAYASIKSVLEFGCGYTGYVAKYKQRGQKAYGVDLHENYRAYWEGLGVEYLRSDGRTIPLDDHAVQLVVSHSVLEHVEDITEALREIDRALKPGGHAYLTVSPLYYSPRGSHRKDLPDWEHLRPGSEHYMMQHPLKIDGAYLNKLTVSQFLAAVGTMPWNIMSMDRKIIAQRIPDWLAGQHNDLDLRTKQFRLVARKIGQRVAAGASREPAVIACSRAP